MQTSLSPLQHTGQRLSLLKVECHKTQYLIFNCKQMPGGLKRGGGGAQAVGKGEKYWFSSVLAPLVWIRTLPTFQEVWTRIGHLRRLDTDPALNRNNINKLKKRFLSQLYHTCGQYKGSLTFWCGSGSLTNGSGSNSFLRWLHGCKFFFSYFFSYNFPQEHYLNIISVRSTPLWEKGRIRIRTSG